MKRKRSSVLVGCLLALSGAKGANAQEVPAEQQIIDEIRVTAPRAVKHKQLPFGQGHEVTLSYAVSYTDLDLRERAGVRELEKRIETAADEICTQLEELFPRGDPSKGECTRRAITIAMADARTVIEALTAP
ncbi:MAG TPA: UrcA family protein [Gammaproteobacteria bacterium]